MRLEYHRKISAAHQLKNPLFTDVMNANVYGCCRKNHGHSWDIIFAVEGIKNEETGMIINFSELKVLIDQLDHECINDFIPLPTAENMVEYFINKLKDMHLFSYIKVQVFEAENASVEDEWRTS